MLQKILESFSASKNARKPTPKWTSSGALIGGEPGLMHPGVDPFGVP
jgi:hypothetical protein